MSDVPVHPACPKCKSLLTSRVKREGVLQTQVFYRFDLYPWECSDCRNKFLFRARGKLKLRRHASREQVSPLG